MKAAVNTSVSIMGKVCTSCIGRGIGEPGYARLPRVAYAIE
jgi:hypothetical protein